MYAEKVGSRVFSSFAVWFTALAWTAAYSEGAGFGAFIYVCSRGALSRCVLQYHPMFPPSVSISAFVFNIVTVWFPGLYDTGLVVGFLLTIVLLAVASQMKRGTLERIFSWPLISIGVLGLAVIGYVYEVHQTLASGVPHVPNL